MNSGKNFIIKLSDAILDFEQNQSIHDRNEKKIYVYCILIDQKNSKPSITGILHVIKNNVCVLQTIRGTLEYIIVSNERTFMRASCVVKSTNWKVGYKKLSDCTGACE